MIYKFLLFFCNYKNFIKLFSSWNMFFLGSRVCVSRPWSLIFGSKNQLSFILFGDLCFVLTYLRSWSTFIFVSGLLQFSWCPQMHPCGDKWHLMSCHGYSGSMQDFLISSSSIVYFACHYIMVVLNNAAMTIEFSCVYKIMVLFPLALVGLLDYVWFTVF